LKKNGQTVPVSLNSKGYRGTREYADYKKPGSFRILAAGDSFTFGFGVHDTETFPAQMEALDPSLEVLNLGVAGYGVDQIYLSAQRELSETHPDLVLISVYPEDFWRATRAFNDAGYGKPYFSLKDGALELRHVPVPRDKNFSTVQFPDLIGKSPLEKFLMNSALYRVTLKAMIRLQKMLGLEDPDSSPEWVLGRVILSHMVHDLKRAGVPAVLVIVPPQRWLTGTVEPVRDSMLRFANREGIDAVDLTPVFQKAFAEKPAAHWYITDDLHWTAAGNRLVAQTLVDYLKNKSLLKAS
jgi:lysophospholipase L1-like esterase